MNHAEFARTLEATAKLSWALASFENAVVPFPGSQEEIGVDAVRSAYEILHYAIYFEISGRMKGEAKTATPKTRRTNKTSSAALLRT